MNPTSISSNARADARKATFIYLIVVLAFSAVLWALIIRSGHLSMGLGMAVMALMWCPALAAFVTCRVMGRSVRSLAWRWPAGRYVAAAYFLPIAYAGLAYAAVWALRLGGWNSPFVAAVKERFQLPGVPTWAVMALFVIFMATAGVIRSVASALGEEIGWRGFLVPELAKQMSFTKLSLLSGVIWAAWHSPLLLFADYNAGTNRWYALGCFAAMVISSSFMFAWLRLKSGSLWTAALLHASHNLFVQGIFDNFMLNTGRTLWYTTEFGAAMVITCAGFALYFWTRRGEVELSQRSPEPAVGFAQQTASSM